MGVPTLNHGLETSTRLASPGRLGSVCHRFKV